VGFYVIFRQADKFEPVAAATETVNTTIPANNNEQDFSLIDIHNVLDPAAMLMLQILAILLVSRIFNWFFAKIGQPNVIGEILAGIALGPSLLGMVFPEAYNFLFAPSSLSNLYILSQIGLVLFMFTVGMELDINALRNKMGVTFVVGNTSILFPFLAGMILAYFIYEEFASAHVDFIPFTLFIGISMSITAFPVLARIIHEKGLAKTHIGAISITAAAFNDVAAWCILAVIIAVTQTGTVVGSLYTIGFCIIYVAIMLLVIRPFLNRIAKVYKNSEVVNRSIFAFFIFILIASAYISQIIGIHAIFGAFLAGFIMPPLPAFRKLIVNRIEDLSLTLFLPLFFVYTGLRTEIGLLNTPHLWFVCLIFILVAIFGKFAGSAFSAKILGESWKDSLQIGVLMNTRGLIEVVILNIGYEMGVLPPAIFVMLVIMALVTTFITTPMLNLITKLFPDKSPAGQKKVQQVLGIFKTMIAMGNPENGKAFLNVAKTVLTGNRNILSINVLHITPGANTNPIYSEDFAAESFEEIKKEALRLEIPVSTDYSVSDNIEQSIIQETNYHNFDFLLVGAGISMADSSMNSKNQTLAKIPVLNKIASNISRYSDIFYPGLLIKDKTKYFIEHSACSVGVFVNRHFIEISTIVVLVYYETDDFLLRYARRMLQNNSAISFFFVDFNNLFENNEAMRDRITDLKTQFPRAIKMLKNSGNIDSVLSKFSFMLTSYQTWNILTEQNDKLLSHIPSTLVINKKERKFKMSE
jgi:Kef-type K+ transport systems, membrane components